MIKPISDEALNGHKAEMLDALRDLFLELAVLARATWEGLDLSTAQAKQAERESAPKDRTPS